MSDIPIPAVGLLLQRLGPALYRASLPNGKETLAHLSRGLARLGAEFEPGQTVLMELTPFDFDHARIVGRAEAADQAEEDGKNPFAEKKLASPSG